MGPPKQRRHWRWKSRRQRGMEYRSQQQLPPSKVKPENERRDVREAPEPVDRKSSKVEAGIDRDTKSEARLRAENKNLKQYRATSNGPGTTDFDLADWYHSQKLESLDSVSAIKAIVGQLDLLRQEAGWPFLYVAYEAPPVSYVRKKKWSSAPVYDFETISSCAMERKEYFSTEAFLADATHAVVSISEEKGELGKRFRIAGLLDGISRQPLPDTAELEGIWDEMTEWALTLAEMKPLNFDDADDFDAHLKRCDKCLDEFRERFVVRLTASEPIGIICRSYFPPGTKWRGTMARCTKRRNKNPQRMQEELCSTWTHFVTANPFLWPGTISKPKLNILTAEYEQGKWKPEAGGVKKECRSETSGMISHDDLAVEFALRQGQNFRFAPWFNRVAQLKERPVKDAVGVIARVFRGQGANKGSLISERRRCLVDAKLVDGGCARAYWARSGACMRRIGYTTFEGFLADFCLSSIHVVATHGLVRLMVLADMRVALDRMKTLHGDKVPRLWTELDHAIDDLCACGKVTRSRQRCGVLLSLGSLRSHLGQCDDLIRAVKEAAAGYGISVIDVCTDVYFPPGTVWRRDAEREACAGTHKKGGHKFVFAMKKLIGMYAYMVELGDGVQPAEEPFKADLSEGVSLMSTTHVDKEFRIGASPGRAVDEKPSTRNHADREAGEDLKPDPCDVLPASSIKAEQLPVLVASFSVRKEKDTPSPSASKGKKRRAIDSEGRMNSRPLSNPERDSLPVSSELGVAGGAKRARLPAVLDECYSLRLKTALDMVTEERGRFGQHAARFDRFEYHVKGLLDGCVTKEQVQEASRKMFEERCIDSLVSLFDSYLNVFLYKLTPDDQEKLETVLSSLKQLLEDMDVVNNLEVVPPLEDNAVVAVSIPLPRRSRNAKGDGS